MDPKSLSADFRDFLKSLNDHGVEYLLIGGHAVAYHGYVRPTQDMDVWIALTPQNAQRMVTLGIEQQLLALADFQTWIESGVHVN